ncbi:MAG: EamA family transporter RarD [Azoarcus sp.]|nr:EamA family transporter RarD [Azoarcus sp.]
MSHNTPTRSASSEIRRGTLSALAAFSIWGLAPLYFRAVGDVPPFEVVAHRVLWSLVFLAALIAFVPGTGRFSAVTAVLRQPRLAGVLALTALLIGSNWLVFVWSIDAGRLIEASLGYFITPLVSVLLGRLFLGERLRPLQQLALTIAVAGVGWRIWQLGALPWIALFLAATFGLYGLLRKRAPVDAVGGLFIETLVTAPLALGWLLWVASRGELAFGSSLRVDLLLPLAGVLTAVPLMLFTVGARRLPLATLGFLQYLAPSLNFLLAVFLFGEPFDHHQLIGFVLIWGALALYTVDMVRHSSNQRAGR